MPEELASLNESIAKTVESLNEKIDYEYQCSSDQLRLARADTSMRKRESLLNQLQKQVTESVTNYENFVTACRESPLDMESRMLLIYRRTRRRAEKALDCGAWDIFPMFPEPSISILPLDASEQRGHRAVSLALFRMKNHYRARSHWSVKGALQHLNSVSQKLEEQTTICESLESANVNYQCQLDAINTRMAEQCLESIQLHHKWRNAYTVYAQHMRLFIRLCENPEDLFKKTMDSGKYQPWCYANLLGEDMSTGSMGLSQTISINELQNATS